MIEFQGVSNPARDDAPEPGRGAGYLAVPEKGGGPGVLLLHAWWGLNDTFRALADRLAGAGYTCLAPDGYGDGSVATTIDEADAMSDALDLVKAEQTMIGAVDRLVVDPSVAGRHIASIGFSMGAGFALWLSHKRPLEVRAVVMVYGTGGGDYTASGAAVQLHYTPQDRYETVEDVRATESAVLAAGRRMESFEYPGVDHWFLEPDRPEYDPASAELAWERILAFLARELGPTEA